MLIESYDFICIDRNIVCEIDLTTQSVSTQFSKETLDTYKVFLDGNLVKSTTNLQSARDMVRAEADRLGVWLPLWAIRRLEGCKG